MAETLLIRQLALRGETVVEPTVAEERRKAFRTLYDGCRGQRFFFDAFWAKGIALVEGRHWLEEAAVSTSHGRRTLRIHPERYDPGIDMVRVTLNWTRPLALDIAALLRVDPEGWRMQFEPDARNLVGSSGEIAVMRRVWRDFVTQDEVDLPGEHDRANHWRVQAGSGLLKMVPDSHCIYGWNIVHVPLDRMVWDVGNVSPEIERHCQWADTMAWPVEEIERQYGFELDAEFKKNLPTLSQLRAFGEMMFNIRSLQPPGSGDSRTKAVLITEFWDDYWKRLTIFIHAGPSSKQWKVVWDGPNPYAGCPFLKLDFATTILAPWGVGVPHIVETPQKVDALAITNVLRHLLTTAAVHWIYEKGSVVDPATVFSPRVGSPIEYDSNFGKLKPPYPMEAPNIPAIAGQLVTMMPQVGRDMAHLPPVMAGKPTGTREAAQAIRARIAQAERPFTAIAERDGERYRRYFTRLVRFLVNRATLPVLLDAVGPELHATLMRMAQRTPRLKARIVVTVPRDAIQPRTPGERKHEIMQWASLKLMSPEEARHEIARVTGRPLTSIEEAALSNADEENRAFLDGAVAYTEERQAAGIAWDIDAKHGDPHDLHIRSHDWVIMNRHQLNLPEPVVTELELHRVDHLEQMGDEAAVRAGVAMEAQGQFGATEAAIEATGQGMPGSPLQGSLAAPEALPTDYARRDTEREALETSMA